MRCFNWTAAISQAERSSPPRLHAVPALAGVFGVQLQVLHVARPHAAVAWPGAHHTDEAYYRHTSDAGQPFLYCTGRRVSCRLLVMQKA